MGEFQVKSLIEGFRLALPRMKAGGEMALHMAPWLGFKTSRSNGLQPETNLYARLKLIKVLETGADTSDSAINGSGEIPASPSEQQQESIEDLQSRQSGLVIDASDLDFAPMLDVRVKTEGDKKAGKVEKLSKGEILMVNVGSTSTGGNVRAVKADLAKIELTVPVCTQVGEKIALSRRVDKHWRLIGWGQINRGKRIEPDETV